jgi:hypothetical protein
MRRLDLLLYAAYPVPVVAVFSCLGCWQVAGLLLGSMMLKALS